MNKKKFKKILISVFIGLFVVGGIFCLLLFCDVDTSENTTGKLTETQKQSTGYYDRIAELKATMVMSDYEASTLLDKILTALSTDRIDSITSIPKGYKAIVGGNYLITKGDYTFETLIRAKELMQINLGKVMVYKYDTTTTLTGTKKTNNAVSLLGTVVSFKVYDKGVGDMQKATGLSHATALNIYKLFSDIGVQNLCEYKKIKGGFICYMGVTPFKVYVSKDVLERITIPFNGTEQVIYTQGDDTGSLSITEFIPMLGERTSMTGGYGYTIPRVMGVKNEIVFPAVIYNADDTWLMVRVPDGVYVEVTADMVVDGKKKQKDFRFISTTKGIVALKVGKKVYK